MGYFKQALVAAVWMSGAVLSAQAATVTVFDTSLANVNGAFGAGVATTTDLAGSPDGRVTSVAGAGGGANRAGATVVADQWSQQNVGAGGVVGITTEFARSGNGSAYLSGTSGDSKADLQIIFSQGVALTSITGLSYDWLRDPSTTLAAGDHLHPVLRLLVANAAGVFGSLIYERIYNPPFPTSVPEGAWQSESIVGADFWASGGLPGAFSVYDRNLSEWNTLLGGLTVYGMQVGSGSGWNGVFEGAVDNVRLTTATSDTTWNFEVADVGEVPEPGTLALAGLALAALGLGRKRRARS